MKIPPKPRPLGVITAENKGRERKEKKEFLEKYVLDHRNLFNSNEECVNSAEGCYELIQRKCK